MDREQLERTLRNFVSLHIDYDIHKSFECDEETGEDTYAGLTDAFLECWEAADAQADH